MRVNVGDTIGQYQLVEQLGRGGMAVVFRAYQPSLDRDVAVKVLNAGGGPDFVERFRREARAVSRLRHPNILSVFDFGEQDDLAYMVGEFVPGGTLAQRLGQPLAPEWIAVRLVALASALDYAHASGLIHRDVKPSNVLLTSNEMPVLSDFGVAKLLAEGAANLTADGTVVGTPEYMSPEQALGHEVGPPSDVYSLGVVLYEMVVGRPPFSGAPMSVALAHVSAPPPRPTAMLQGLPVSVERVLLRALAKSPAERYQRASDLAVDFAAAIGADIYDLANQAAVTPPSSPRVTPSTPPALPLALPSTPTPAPGPTPGSRPAVQATPPMTPDAWPTVSHTPRPGPTRPGVPKRPASAGRQSLVGILIGLIVALALVAAVVSALRDPGPVVTAPTATPVPAAPTALAIAATATPEPALAPTPTLDLPTPTPTLPVRLAPTPSTLTARVVNPASGARVPETTTIRGVTEGPSGPNDHLWLLARPAQGPENWWVDEKEIVPSASGEWQTQIFLGGSAGTLHRLAIVKVDAAGQAMIKRHLAERKGDPLPGGLPAGLTILTQLIVEKSG